MSTAPSRQCLLLDWFFDAGARRAVADRNGAARDRLLTDAEACLSMVPPTVLDKRHVPPSGDKRDYFSLSPYFWPDPARPGGLPYISRDGRINPESDEYDRPGFGQMCAAVDTLALAYALSGRERFAEKAAEYLRTWFLDERTGMRPHLLYAQYIPGENVTTPWKEYPARYVPGIEGRGKGIYVSFGGVIDGGSLTPLTDSIRLIRASSHWSREDDRKMRDWYEAYTHWLQTHQHGKDEASCRNNHGSWHLANVACFLEFAGRPDAALAEIDAGLPDRLRLQVRADGSQPEELGRTRSETYVLFSLRSLVNIVLIADRNGRRNIWDNAPRGCGSIRAAVDWFLPYLAGGKAWTWNQLDPFDPAAAGLLLELAAHCSRDQRYADALGAIPIAPDDRRRLLLSHVSAAENTPTRARR